MDFSQGKKPILRHRHSLLAGGGGGHLGERGVGGGAGEGGETAGEGGLDGGPVC